jgi:glycosyltransferase involved in cell wall biosynthesis
MLAELDGITVVNRQQKEYLTNIVGIPARRVFVIPNIVEDVFFDPPASPPGFDPGLEGYVLCTGNICPRKNQLALIQACRRIGVPLLLVGHLLTGEAEYGRAVEEEIGDDPQVRWVRGLPQGSAHLAAAYRRAAVFALPSYKEEQPLSALEAVAARKPLILGDRPYARQDYYAGALVADPRSVAAIAAALRKAYSRPDEFRPPDSAIQSCRRATVGRAYADAYDALGSEL